jgi:hypothetical protein
MTKEGIEEKKNELMQERWTEDMHTSLKNLDPKVAKKVVESMSDSEIYVRVNHRNLQEDYIADYLEFLWEISEEAFWKHVNISLDPALGVLWGDHMPHFEKMCNHKLPEEILEKVLYFLINYESDHPASYEMDMDAVGCVIRAQVKKFNQTNKIEDYIKTLNILNEEEIFKKIVHFINQRCHYHFG